MPTYIPPRRAPEANSPHWYRDPLTWEVEQERWRHNDALYNYGEYSMFVLMWQVEDGAKGLVQRCSVCYTSFGEITQAYKQPAREDCPSCFGTSWEGGFKAKIIRPALWDIGAKGKKVQKQGETQQNVANVQSTSDFELQNFDHVFRGDGTRWSVQSLSVSRLHSGFRYPHR